MSKAPKQKKESEEVLRLKDQLARALADYANFQKRVERERDDLRSILTGRIVGKFLPVLDMLYEAQSHLNDSGLALTISSFEESLKEEGLEAISPKEGEEFNEEMHEAVDTGTVEGLKSNQIISCSLRGWKFRVGQVIRHAKVVVNKEEQK